MDIPLPGETLPQSPMKHAAYYSPVTLIPPPSHPPPLPSAHPPLLPLFGDIPMPDDHTLTDALVAPAEDPNRYSPSGALSEDDPPLLPSPKNTNQQSTRFSVLGKIQAKKRLLAFSATKQAGGAGLAFNLPKKSIVRPNPAKEFDSTTLEEDKSVDNIVAKKKPAVSKKGSSREDKARAVVSAIEEIKREELLMRGAFRMAIESKAPGNMTAPIPLQGLPVAVLQTSTDDKQLSDRQKVATDLLIDNLLANTDKDSKRGEARKEDRRSRRRSERRSKERQRERRERKKPKKELLKLPTTWSEVQASGMKLEDIRRKKLELESKHTSSSRSRLKEAPKDPMELEKELCNPFDNPAHVRMPLRVTGVRQREKEFSWTLIQHTIAKPVVTYCVNPASPSAGYKTRAQILVHAKPEAIKIMNAIMEGTGIVHQLQDHMKTDEQLETDKRSRAWYPKGAKDNRLLTPLCDDSSVREVEIDTSDVVPLIDSKGDVTSGYNSKSGSQESAAISLTADQIRIPSKWDSDYEEEVDVNQSKEEIDMNVDCGSEEVKEPESLEPSLMTDIDVEECREIQEVTEDKEIESAQCIEEVHDKEVVTSSLRRTFIAGNSDLKLVSEYEEFMKAVGDEPSDQEQKAIHNLKEPLETKTEEPEKLTTLKSITDVEESFLAFGRQQQFLEETSRKKIAKIDTCDDKDKFTAQLETSASIATGQSSVTNKPAGSPDHIINTLKEKRKKKKKIKDKKSKKFAVRNKRQKKRKKKKRPKSSSSSSSSEELSGDEEKVVERSKQGKKKKKKRKKKRKSSSSSSSKELTDVEEEKEEEPPKQPKKKKKRKRKSSSSSSSMELTNIEKDEVEATKQAKKRKKKKIQVKKKKLRKKAKRIETSSSDESSSSDSSSDSSSEESSSSDSDDYRRSNKKRKKLSKKHRHKKDGSRKVSKKEHYIDVDDSTFKAVRISSPQTTECVDSQLQIGDRSSGESCWEDISINNKAHVKGSILGASELKSNSDFQTDIDVNESENRKEEKSVSLVKHRQHRSPSSSPDRSPILRAIVCGPSGRIVVFSGNNVANREFSGNVQFLGDGISGSENVTIEQVMATEKWKDFIEEGENVNVVPSTLTVAKRKPKLMKSSSSDEWESDTEKWHEHQQEADKFFPKIEEASVILKATDCNYSLNVIEIDKQEETDVGSSIDLKTSVSYVSIGPDEAVLNSNHPFKESSPMNMSTPSELDFPKSSTVASAEMAINVLGNDTKGRLATETIPEIIQRRFEGKSLTSDLYSPGQEDDKSTTSEEMSHNKLDGDISSACSILRQRTSVHNLESSVCCQSSNISSDFIVASSENGSLLHLDNIPLPPQLQLEKTAHENLDELTPMDMSLPREFSGKVVMPKRLSANVVLPRRLSGNVLPRELSGNVLPRELPENDALSRMLIERIEEGSGEITSPELIPKLTPVLEPFQSLGPGKSPRQHVITVKLLSPTSPLLITRPSDIESNSSFPLSDFGTKIGEAVIHTDTKDQLPGVAQCESLETESAKNLDRTVCESGTRAENVSIDMFGDIEPVTSSMKVKQGVRKRLSRWSQPNDPPLETSYVVDVNMQIAGDFQFELQSSENDIPITKDVGLFTSTQSVDVETCDSGFNIIGQDLSLEDKCFRDEEDRKDEWIDPKKRERRSSEDSKSRENDGRASKDRNWSVRDTRRDRERERRDSRRKDDRRRNPIREDVGRTSRGKRQRSPIREEKCRSPNRYKSPFRDERQRSPVRDERRRSTDRHKILIGEERLRSPVREKRKSPVRENRKSPVREERPRSIERPGSRRSPTREEKRSPIRDERRRSVDKVDRRRSPRKEEKRWRSLDSNQDDRRHSNGDRRSGLRGKSPHLGSIPLPLPQAGVTARSEELMLHLPSLPDSTVIDSELVPATSLRPASTEMHFDKDTDASGQHLSSVVSPPSPKRLSLDERLALELGVEISPQSQSQPLPVPHPHITSDLYQMYEPYPAAFQTYTTPEGLCPVVKPGLLPTPSPDKYLGPTIVTQFSRLQDHQINKFAHQLQPPQNFQQISYAPDMKPFENTFISSESFSRPPPAINYIPRPTTENYPVQSDHLQNLVSLHGGFPSRLPSVPSGCRPTISPGISQQALSCGGHKGVDVQNLATSPSGYPSAFAVPYKSQAPCLPETPVPNKAKFADEPKASMTKLEKERLERRRKKELRRREKEQERWIKLKKAAKYKAVLQQEGEVLRRNSCVNLEEVRLVTADTAIKSIKISTVSSKSISEKGTPLPKAGRGILISAGFRDDPVEIGVKKTPKSVTFADNVRPGEGTSPSGGEDLPSSPPYSPGTRKEKKLHKKKQKIKVQVIRKSASGASDKRVLPPPPPTIPPPPLDEPRKDLNILVWHAPPEGFMWKEHKKQHKQQPSRAVPNPSNRLPPPVESHPAHFAEPPNELAALVPMHSIPAQRRTHHSLIQVLGHKHIQEQLKALVPRQIPPFGSPIDYRGEDTQHKVQVPISATTYNQYNISSSVHLSCQRPPMIVLPLKFPLSQIKSRTTIQLQQPNQAQSIINEQCHGNTGTRIPVVSNSFFKPPLIHTPPPKPFVYPPPPHHGIQVIGGPHHTVPVPLPRLSPSPYHSPPMQAGGTYLPSSTRHPGPLASGMSPPVTVNHCTVRVRCPTGQPPTLISHSPIRVVFDPSRVVGENMPYPAGATSYGQPSSMSEGQSYCPPHSMGDGMSYHHSVLSYSPHPVEEGDGVPYISAHPGGDVVSYGAPHSLGESLHYGSSQMVGDNLSYGTPLQVESNESYGPPYHMEDSQTYGSTCPIEENMSFCSRPIESLPFRPPHPVGPLRCPTVFDVPPRNFDHRPRAPRPRQKHRVYRPLTNNQY